MRKKWIIRATFQVENWLAAVELLREIEKIKITGDTISNFQLEELQSFDKKANKDE